MQVKQAPSTEASRSVTLFAILVAHFGHHLATAAAIPLLPMIRDSLQMDYFQAGVMLSSYSLTYGFGQLPMGAVADRFGKRRVIALGLLANAAACLVAALSTSYLQMITAMVLMGLGGSTYHGPAAAFLAQTFGREGRGRSMGIHVVGGSAGLAVSPVVAILVAGLTGSWRNSFLVIALPVLIGGVLLWVAVRAQESANDRAEAGGAAERFHPVEVLRVLGPLLGIAVLTQLLSSGMQSYLPLYLVDKHGASREVAGLMLTLVFGFGLIGAPIGGALSDRIGRKPVIMISVVSAGPLILLVTLIPFGPLLAAVIALYGGIIIFRLPVIDAWISDVVPARRRATALGAYYFLAQETAGVFTPILGWMADQFGLNTGFTLLGGIGVGFSCLVLLLRRRI